MDVRNHESGLKELTDFVQDECGKRLRAYEAQPRDAAEHYETENEVLSGGYAYRQLYELVQNAADAILESGAPEGRIHVFLSRRQLEVANSGAALDEAGIVALLNARSSAKRGNQIGRFGIGFKSLLKLGGRVDLMSRSAGLRFDPEACRARIRAHLGLAASAAAPGMRLAEVLDPAAEGSPLCRNARWSWATTVVSAEITDAGAFDRLSQEIADFPAEFLLFLPATVSLVLEVEGGAGRHLSKRLEEGFAIVGDALSEARWKIFETRVSVDSPEALSDATHIQARDQLPLTWAVPLGGREQAGRFWAFFPTETQSRTSGILNAPWKLNSDRTNLIRGPWNEAIMQAAADLICDSLAALSGAGDRGAAVSAFPRQPERQDEIAVPLVRALWDRIIGAEVLPDALGIARRPESLLRHAFDTSQICSAWAALAGPESARRYLHPDCYASEARVSRLNALREEGRRRGSSLLAKSTPGEWLSAIATPEPECARKVLTFVSSLLRGGGMRLSDLAGIGLIPTAEGGLASAAEAVILSGSALPAGYRAVADEIASDSLCREILLSELQVTELAPAAWSEILDSSLKAAAASDLPAGWRNFWDNFASAPEEARQRFTRTLALNRLKFFSVSGAWVERGLLVVAEEPGGLPVDHVMDPGFFARIKPLLPEDWLGEFPSGSEVTDCDHPRLAAYFRFVRPVFDAKCNAHSGRKPYYAPVTAARAIGMPAGWQLLSLLPPQAAARLSRRLLSALAQWDEKASTVTLCHPTRPEAYPKVTAPHPLWHWLTAHGQSGLGSHVIPLNSISAPCAEALAAAEIPGFSEIAGFLRARGAGTDLPAGFAWPGAERSPEAVARFWDAVFRLLAERSRSFRALAPLWELAAAEGAIPAFLPTSDGALALSDIFVTSDPRLGENCDDGRIVLLSEAAAAAWQAAGAKPLGTGPSLSFHRRLSDPASLTDLLPELSAGAEGAEALSRLPWVRVSDLTESLGPSVRPVAVGIDVDGTLLIDHEQFSRPGRKESIALLLRCLARHSLLPEGADPEEMLARIMDRRSDEARAAVRAEPTLAQRLLRAIGGDTRILRESFTPAICQAVGEDADPQSLARLALAVHGPTLLSRFRDVLEEEGLAPPGRWGGEPSRLFVQALGFPIEFAASTGGRRAAELSVSGPLRLPPLHEYQEEILTDIAGLLATGPGRRRAVVSLPTGGGKTRVAAEAVVRLVLRGEGQRSALWIAQTDELCEQAVQCFRQLWVNVGAPGEDLRIVRFWGGQRNPAPPEGDEPTVVIASVQTLNSRAGRPELDWLVKAGIIIIDECHHAISASYTDLLRWLDLQTGSERARVREAPVLGLSATPWRGYDEEESERLAARFDRRWFPADQAGLHDRLSAMGVLAARSYRPLHAKSPVTLSEREQQHVDRFHELPDSVAERMGEDKSRNDLIIDAIVSSRAGSVLLFANSVAHAQYLAARLHLAGCPAAAVSGQTDRLARQHFTRRFRAGDLRVICNHSLLTTGFDAPQADMVLISRPVFSPVLYMQMVGRGLRGPANGGTDHCEIVTVEDNIVSFKERLAYHFCRRFFDG